MQHFFQSPFLQALGFAIANSLWQTAMLWLIFMCVNSLPLTAAVKYRLAVGAQATSFIWFLVTFQFYYAQYSHNAGQLNTIQVTDTLPANGGLTTQLADWMVRGEQLLPYVSMAYLLLMVFLCSRWFLGYRHTQSIRFNGLHKIPVDWRLFVKKIAAQLGIRKEIAIFLSDTVSTPVTIGFLKPVILIPVASINHLTIHQLEAVILHELAHIKRYDYLVNMILSVAEIGLFFNPFTQLLSRNIRKERENSCDDWVLQFRYNATTYAEALLRIAYLQSAPAFAMAATGKKNDLLARVKRMIEKKENRFNYRKQLLAFLVVTGMLSSIAWLNPIAKPHNEITARGKQAAMQPRKAQVTADHPKMNLDNPLFNPVFFLSDPLKAEIKKGLASAEKELHFTEGEPEAPFAPMIADAFDQASFELMGKKEWEEAIAKMDFAKMKLDNVFNFDTASLPMAVRGPLKEDLARSLKSMETDIAKAKVEMSKAMKMAGDIKLEREKINRDIKNAMDVLQKLPLDKIVYNALQVPAMLFGDEARKQQPIRKPRLKGTDKIKLQEHVAEDVHPENESPLAEEHPDMDEEMTTPHLQEDALSPALLAELAKLPNADIIGKDLVKMLRFKKFLKELEKLQANPKMIPVVFKERKAEDKKAAVQLR